MPVPKAPARSILETFPVATLIVAIIAIAGAVLVIVHPETLTFAEYVRNVGVAAGLLAVGRGLAARKVS